MKGRKCRTGITTLSDLTNVAKVFQTDNCLNKFTNFENPITINRINFQEERL